MYITRHLLDDNSGHSKKIECEIHLNDERNGFLLVENDYHEGISFSKKQAFALRDLLNQHLKG